MKKILICLFYFLLFDSQYTFPQSGWIYRNLGTAGLTSIYFINFNTGYIAGCLSSGYFFYKTTNGGLNWTSINAGSGTVLSLKVFDETNIILFGNLSSYGMFKYSRNGGLNWTDYYLSPNQEQLSPGGINWLDINMGYSVFVDYGTTNYYGRIFKTTNGGINWYEQFPSSSSAYYDVKIKNEDTAFLLAGATLMRTANKGNNWIAYSTIGGIPRNLFFVNYDTIYSGGVEIKRSVDKGISWTTQHIVTNYKTIRKMFFINSKTGWAVGGGSSYYNIQDYIVKTTNAGINWQVQDSNNYKCLRDVFFFNEYTGWIVGDSGTILKTTTGGVSFIKYENNEIPTEYKLNQNYPNPYNPSTTIIYALPHSGNVKLVVYDVLGRMIKTLVNEKQSPGTYEVIFNASQYPSGIYFYKLEARNYTDVKRMILTK